MPWTAKQNHLFRAIEHGWKPPGGSGIKIGVADATRMAHEGVRRARGGLAQDYADGGRAETAGAVAGGGLAALGALAALSPRRFNSLVRPVQRALTRPTFATEAVSKEPLSAAQSRERFELARSAADHPFENLPVEEGRGAWLSNGVLEENPLYMQRLPRHLGRMDRNDDALEYAATMGQLLDQKGVPLARAIPNALDVSEGSNALLARGVDRGALSTLARELGGDSVVAHQPGNEALIFSLADDPIEALRARAQRAVPSMKLRYGRSDPGVDRLLVGSEDWMDVPYSRFGENPRTQFYSRMERKLLGSRMAKDPATAAGLPEY